MSTSACAVRPQGGAPATVDGPHLATTAAGAFDYGALAPEVADHARGAAAQIRALVERAVGDIIATGNILRAVKAKLDHGQFGRWLAAEFYMSERTAQRFMRAAEWADGKSDTVSLLQPASLYLLAARSTPTEVERSVLDRMRAGERVDPGTIRKMVAAARDEARRAAVEARRREAEAQLTPQQRKRRERREEREARRREEWARETAEREAAAADLAELLRRRLDGDLPRFLKLIVKVSVHEVVDRLRRGE